jgi:TP901 family phage tail tape measure protein
MATFKLVVNLTARTTEFERSLKSLERDLGKLERNLENVGSKLTASLTAPILALGGAAGKLASDFDDGMSSMKALIGLTGDEVARLKTQVLALAPAVAQSPKELAESLTLITSAGQRGAQAMDTLRVSAKAAAAGLGQTREVADAATSVMNAYGAEQISAAQAVSVFIAAAREGKTSLGALAPAMSGVLPLAADLGVRFDEVAGAMAAMTRKGLEAGQASAGLRSVLATLINPSAQAQDALVSMGLSAEGLRAQLKEKGLLAVLDTLRGKFGENEDALTRVFPNAKALSSVLALMGKDAEGTRGVLGRLAATTENELNRAFKETENDASFRFRQGLEQMRVLGIQFGDTILQVAVPAMRMFAGAVQDATVWYQGLSDNTKALIIVTAGLAAVIGPLVLAAAALVGTFANLVNIGRTMIPIFTTLFALLGGPGLAAAIALGAAAVFIMNRWEILKESLSVIADFIVEKFQDSLLGKVLGFHVTFFQKVGELLTPFGQVVKDGIGSGFLAAKDFATVELDQLAERASTTFQGIVEKAGALSAGLMAQFQAAAPAMTAPVETVTATMAETQAKTAETMNNSVSSWKKVGNAIDAGASSVQTTLAGLKAEMSDTGAAMQGAMRGMASESARSLGALTASFAKGKVSLEQFVQQMIQQIMMLIAKILILRALTAVGMGGPFASGFIGGMFAEGGRPPVGVPSIVGEKGPELFVPDTAGTIVPNSALGMAGGGSTIGSVQILIPDAGNPRATAEAVVDALNERLLAPGSKEVTLARRLGRADRLNSGRSA